MSQEVFGMKLGVTGAGISKIEGGTRSLTEQMILLMCREFDVNENWLRNGDGDIFRQKYPPGIEQLAGYYHLDELDRRIIYEYTMLEDSKRKVIKDYIMKIAYGSGNSSILMDNYNGNEIPRCAEGQDSI